MPLDQEWINALSDSFRQSRSHLYARLLPTRQLIADVYTGRDPSISRPPGWFLSAFPTQAVNLDQIRLPDNTANLLFATTQTLVAATFPATPSVRAEALTDGATPLAEDQTLLNDFTFLHAGTDEAAQRADYLALNNGWAGMKLVGKRQGPLHRRVRVLAVDPLACGWEPFLRRYFWHTYIVGLDQVPDSYVPKGQGAAPLRPWSLLEITEIYVEQWGGVKSRMVVFSKVFDHMPGPDADAAQQQATSELGEYVHDEPLSICPLALLQFTEPAHGEDVPPSEVLQWLPLIRSITKMQDKIDRQGRFAGIIYLYLAGWIADKDIKMVLENPDAIAHFIKVGPPKTWNPGPDEPNVDSKLRPVEMRSILPELVQALQVQLNLFDRVSGVFELQRGEFPSGTQTATEVVKVSTNAELRNLRRREKMADALAQLGHVLLANQRDWYGERITIPGTHGLLRDITIPSGAAAEFSVRVDAVELGHMARRGDLQGIFQGFQLILQANGEQRGSMTAAAREGLRRTLSALGWTDVKTFVPPVVSDDNPPDAMMEHLLRGTPIIARPGQDHAAHIAYLRGFLEAEETRENPNRRAMGEAAAAIMDHQNMERASRAPQVGQGAEVAGTAAQAVASPSPMTAALLSGGRIPQAATPVL